MKQLYCKNCKIFILNENLLNDWTCEICWTEVFHKRKRNNKK